MNQAEQIARARRFSGRHSVIVTDCGNGQFGVHQWGGCGDFLGIANSHEELAALILSRPAYNYVPQPRPPKIVAGINLDELEIDL